MSSFSGKVSKKSSASTNKTATESNLYRVSEENTQITSINSASSLSSLSSNNDSFEMNSTKTS